jgi:hypothetical protein
MQTLEEIHREGLAALCERLGRAGMIRFLSQYDNGNGNYADDRHEWVDGTSLAEISQESLSPERDEDS